MFPQKWGFLYLAGLLPAMLLSFIPIPFVADFIGFLLMSLIVSGMISKYGHREFHGLEIVEVAATCSLTLAAVMLAFIIVSSTNIYSLVVLVLVTLSRFVAVGAGMLIFNKIGEMQNS